MISAAEVCPAARGATRISDNFAARDNARVHLTVQSLAQHLPVMYERIAFKSEAVEARSKAGVVDRKLGGHVSSSSYSTA